ncbi:hypothetical protein BCCH1_03450 [Burkholderia contaminans]|nr:hypothetical protein BCCH1_03450 [Burkholderia contaminans]GLZ71589.1 hypothetical protein Bcon01_46340 [Burkholderia contaminans]
MDERRRGERTGVLRTEVKRIGKDQPMIESGAGAVYEAFVRRKSRAAIWRKPCGIRGTTGRPAGRLAEISAWAAGEFRNLGQPVGPIFQQTKQTPYESMN